MASRIAPMAAPSLRIGRPNTHTAVALTDAHLARQAAPGRVVAEEVEHFELLVFRGLEEIGTLEHIDPARAAARAPAREGNARGLLVAEVDQPRPLWGAHLEQREAGAFEDNDGHCRHL
jgi:hypothetical protein